MTTRPKLAHIARSEARRLATLLAVLIFIGIGIIAFGVCGFVHKTTVDSRVSASHAYLVQLILIGDLFGIQQHLSALVLDGPIVEVELNALENQARTVQSSKAIDPLGIDFHHIYPLKSIDQIGIGTLNITSRLSLVPFFVGILAALLAYIVIYIWYFRRLERLVTKVIAPLSELTVLVKSHSVITKEDIDHSFGHYDEIYSIASAHQDTLQKRVEEQSRMESMQADQAIAQASSFIAHDLRGPLGVLERMLLNGDINTEIASSTLVRMHSLINAFRFQDVGRIVRPTKHTVGFVAFGEELKLHASERHIAFSFTCPNEPIEVILDQPKFERMVLNLVRNACEAATQRAAVRIEVKGNHLIVTVEDDGLGVPSEIEKNLFGKGVSNKETGTGLGLHFSKMVVDGHGGTIDYERIDSLTRFTVQMPNAVVSPLAKPSTDTAAPIPKNKTSSLITINVSDASLRAALMDHFAKESINTEISASREDFARSIMIIGEGVEDLEEAIEHSIPYAEVTSLKDISRVSKQAKFLLQRL